MSRPSRPIRSRRAPGGLDAGSENSFPALRLCLLVICPWANARRGQLPSWVTIDGARTWKAVASFFDNCPHRSTVGSPEAHTFEFTVPPGMPSGDALFVWLWLNREHESFVNAPRYASFRVEGNKSQGRGHRTHISLPTGLQRSHHQ
jgi:hypothetical protein